MDTMSYLLGKKSGGGSGTSNYSDLTNKPKINNVELNGNKTSSDLGIQDILVSGTNIKTINNTSLLGSGDITIGGGSSPKYKLVMNVDSAGTITNFNTQDNRDLFADIVADFNNISINDIYIYASNWKYYGINEIDWDDDQLRLRVIIFAGSSEWYGVEYWKYKISDLYANFSNGTTEEINKYDKDAYAPIGVDMILGINNSRTFTPTNNYQPATKKYVDDSISTAIGTALNSSY